MIVNSKYILNKLHKYTWHLLALLIFVFSFFSALVGKLYTHFIFKNLAQFLRFITSKVPFAIGEWVYLFLIIGLIINVLYKLYTIKKRIKADRFLAKQLNHLLRNLCIVYVFFELIWGLNYQKNTPASDFNLKVNASYSEEEVDTLSLNLIYQMNEARSKLSDSMINKVTVPYLFDKSIQEYARIVSTYPFLEYSNSNLKQAQFPSWGDKIGYLAFYHPITGEAIIRGDLPILTQPYTICHEIAHQIGYASEMEANFISFIVATQSDDVLFKYSMLLQLFTYSQQAQLNLIAQKGDYKKWKKIIERNKALLSPQVIADRKNIRSFFMSRQNQRIPGSEKLYDQFLQLNKQTKGIESYNDVLLWALAYYEHSS